VQRAFAQFGLNITRGAVNRFEAMEVALNQLKARAYAPKTIIDGGANVGRWTEMAHRVFPGATHFMIEPQPACQPLLQAAASRIPRAQVMNFALVQPGIDSVMMAGSGPDSTAEGAWIPTKDQGSVQGQRVPATTLDALFPNGVPTENRTFLKLDLDGYEYRALTGAERLLSGVEVIVSEVHFYDINHAGQEHFSDLVSLLRPKGFIVYDFARLLGRRRDSRLYLGDVVFVRENSPLAEDVSWR
jgi:FkbM family methyltransferase